MSAIIELNNYVKQGISDEELADIFYQVDLKDPAVSLIDMGFDSAGYGQWEIYAQIIVNGNKMRITDHYTNAEVIDNWKEAKKSEGYKEWENVDLPRLLYILVTGNSGKIYEIVYHNE